MILIFDYFETIVLSSTHDFNRALKAFWGKYYQDRCSFEEIKALGEELFTELMTLHRQGIEFPFVKEELPRYAERFGGETVPMDTEEEADFLMEANGMSVAPGLAEMLEKFKAEGIPMYVLSNSGFTAGALHTILNRLGIGQYFSKVWSSAEYGRTKPDRGFFEQAIGAALSEHPGERREDIVFVGDIYETDVVGAFQAGIKAAWIDREGARDEAHPATYIISETSELTDILLKQ